MFSLAEKSERDRESEANDSDSDRGERRTHCAQSIGRVGAMLSAATQAAVTKEKLMMMMMVDEDDRLVFGLVSHRRGGIV